MTTRQTDPFLLQYDANELETATEFLSIWLPFLTRDLCPTCTRKLSDRIRCLTPGIDNVKEADNYTVSDPKDTDFNECNCDTHSIGSWKDNADINDKADTNSLGSWQDVASPYTPNETSNVKLSWADMAQEDELENELNKTNGSYMLDDFTKPKTELSRDQRELIRFRSVNRQKEFSCFERVNGKFVNILEGLELHCGVFSAAEQKRIVSFVEELQEKGKNGELSERTYTAPQKWMKGKGRVTLQFGCCYNYATDKKGNPPGILRNSAVDPFPPIFKTMIKRLVRWHVMPTSCVPDSCIVNIYDEGDCIPPHIDSHDFVRPFCTISFLSECDIVFGTTLKILNPGVFAGSMSIPLPVGSVLVLNGNGADVAKHCVPSVPTKRISITFRRMDETKRPIGYAPEPDLLDIQPFFDEDSSKLSESMEKEVYKGDGLIERSLDNSKPRVYLEKEADYREGNRNQNQNQYNSRERSVESLKTKQYWEKKVDYRERSGDYKERNSDLWKPKQFDRGDDSNSSVRSSGSGSLKWQYVEKKTDHNVYTETSPDSSKTKQFEYKGDKSSEYRYQIRNKPGGFMNRRDY